MKETEVIHSWSAPRSLSTSLMYSFAQVPISSCFYASFCSQSFYLFIFENFWCDFCLRMEDLKWVFFFFFGWGGNGTDSLKHKHPCPWSAGLHLGTIWSGVFAFDDILWFESACFALVDLKWQFVWSGLVYSVLNWVPWLGLQFFLFSSHYVLFNFFYLLRNGGSSSSSSEPYGIWGRLLDAWEFDFHLWMILSLVMTRTVPLFRKFIPVWTNWIPVLIRIVLDQYYSLEFWLIQSSKYQASWILFIIGSKSFHSYCDLTFYGWKPLGSEWNLVWLHPTGLVLVCVWRELGHTV